MERLDPWFASGQIVPAMWVRGKPPDKCTSTVTCGASTATRLSRNGRHMVGWTAVEGYFASWKLSLDQLWVCRKGRSQKVGYPGGVASQLAAGAELGLCEADLPKQYKDNY